MIDELDGKTIVIAGVGPGLGEETARAVLREGGQVVLGARHVDRLSAIARGLDESGKRVAECVCDVDREGDSEALVALAESRFGRVDGLVCVAHAST